MVLMLLDLSRQIAIHIPVSEQTASIFEEQFSRLPDRDARDAYGRRAAPRVEPALLDSLDWDLCPPTAAQISYARAISKGLGVEIPPDAMRIRTRMRNFLSVYSTAFKAKIRKGLADPPS